MPFAIFAGSVATYQQKVCSEWGNPSVGGANLCKSNPLQGNKMTDLSLDGNLHKA